MDPSLIPTPLNVRNLLREYDLSPRKSLGQNFLVDNGALEKVVDAAEIEPVDVVLEIGAGLGSLTRFLSAAARKVVAVELDSHLIPILET
ncbi:MAG: 16S rRNA (adenine(1518)-N(6)/adenine(1519)-N(6))-dimethyltransferase, partial [Anaerolineaceae bacterium]|nr:16S rRNA (adenine(1518)-N(6)/adenine(1519)-N(6))-dimethyltransferase [Anaerolineaceae bacterium]